MPASPFNSSLTTTTDKPTEFGAAHAAGVLFGQTQAAPLIFPGEEGQEDGVPFVFLNGNVVDLRNYMPTRLSKLGLTFHDPASLIAYINKYKMEDTAIFAAFKTDGGTFTAVFDFPAPGATARREHTASFSVRPTPAWAAWLAADGKQQNQDQFCEFVEKWRGLFQEPTAAEMLELARYIEGKKEGQFTFGKRLQTGDRQILWKEDTQIRSGASGGEPTAIPEIVKVCIPLFEGTEPVPVSAWLRVSVSHGAVSFKLETRDLDKTVRESLTLLRNMIRDETSLLVYLGGIGS